MRSYESLLLLAVFCGPPAAVTAGLGLVIRRSGDWKVQMAGRAAFLMLALLCWFLPKVQRTNEPGPEGIVLEFLLLWGPVIAAAWLGLQEVLGANERRSRRQGFPVIQAALNSNDPPRGAR